MKYNAECRTAYRTNWSVSIPETDIDEYRDKMRKQFRSIRNDFIDIGNKEPCFIKRADIILFNIERQE